MDHQNHYCENEHIAKTGLQIQYNSHQNSNDIPHRQRKFKSKIHMRAWKTWNSKSKSSAEDIKIPGNKIILHSHSNKNSMALALKKTQTFKAMA
jgi:hypothetical protein